MKFIRLAVAFICVVLAGCESVELANRETPQKKNVAVAAVPPASHPSVALQVPSYASGVTATSLSLDVAAGYDAKVGNAAQFSFSMDGMPWVSLYDASNKEQKDRVGLSRAGNRYTATVSFPEAGHYTVWVSAPKPGGRTWTGVASLQYDAQAGNDLVFPRLYWDKLDGDLALDMAKGYKGNVGSSAKISFTMEGAPVVSLYDANGKPLDGRAGLSRAGNRWTATISFPAAGHYTVWVNAPQPDGQGWTGVASVPFDAQSGSELVFPRFSWDKLDTDLALDVSTGYASNVGSSTQFSFVMEGAPFVSVYDANEKQLDSRVGLSKAGNRWTATVSFPASGHYTVWIGAPKRDGQGWMGVASLPYDARAGSEIVFPRFYWDRLGTDLSLSVKDGYAGRVGGSAEFSFSASGDSSVALYTPDGKEIPGRTDLARAENEWTARVYFPAPGAYTVWVNSATPGAATQRGVASLAYQAEAASELPVLKPGSDWAKARRIENASWSVDKDPEVVRLTPLVKADPHANLGSLVKALVAGKADDFERVRALHDWIAKNIAYDYSALKGLSPTITEPYQVISRGSSVCAGYSEVFFLMCSLARIQSRVVSGFGRGLNFSVFDPQTGPFKNNHAWNAVQIDGGWYLVDATWDAGHIDGATDSFAWHYSRSFLFTPPEIFLCTHLPEDPRWQLQPRPIGEAQFGALPFLEGEFGKMGFSATGLALVTQVKGTCKFSIGLPAGWELTSYVYAADKTTTNPTQKVQTRKVGDAMEFEVPFPSAGRYGLSLAARPAGSSANSIYVGSLYFIAVK